MNVARRLRFVTIAAAVSAVGPLPSVSLHEQAAPAAATVARLVAEPARGSLGAG